MCLIDALPPDPGLCCSSLCVDAQDFYVLGNLGLFLPLGHALYASTQSGAPLSARRANLAANRSPIFREMRPNA
jgi:hypothetical protein